MTVRVYRSSDVGAPTLNNTAGSMINVLDACLVTGYGSKPSSGWTKEYSGTNKAAYKQGALATYNQYYLQVDNTGTYYAFARGFETMSDVDTGTNPFPNILQSATSGTSGRLTWMGGSIAGGCPWIVVATERTFYLWNMYNAGVYSPSSMSFVWAFGDFESILGTVDKGNCMIAGTTALTINGAQPVDIYQFNQSVNVEGRFLARSINGIVPSVQFANCGSYFFSHDQTYLTVGIAPIPTPNPSNNQLYYSRMQLIESGASSGQQNMQRGYWKGVIVPYNGGRSLVTSAGTSRIIAHGDQLTLPEYPGRLFEAVGCKTYSNNNSYSFILIEVSDTW